MKVCVPTEPPPECLCPDECGSQCIINCDGETENCSDLTDTCLIGLITCVEGKIGEFLCEKDETFIDYDENICTFSQTCVSKTECLPEPDCVCSETCGDEPCIIDFENISSSCAEGVQICNSGKIVDYKCPDDKFIDFTDECTTNNLCQAEIYA